MRIQFRKISNDQHELVVDLPSGQRHSMRCETRSYLLHDFLHYCVESEAGLESGFWGSLAAGRPLAELNERAQMVAELATSDPAEVPAGVDGELLMVEGVVGAMHGLTKGVAAADLFAGMLRYAEARGRPWPSWLDAAFVERVAERMRRVRGQWAATAFGEPMTLTWPAVRDASGASSVSEN